MPNVWLRRISFFRFWPTDQILLLSAAESISSFFREKTKTNILYSVTTVEYKLVRFLLSTSFSRVYMHNGVETKENQNNTG